MQVGLEGILHLALRCPDISALALGNDFVESLAVGCHDILYIGSILQPAFYLERHHSGCCQGTKIVDTTHVFQRKQMALVDVFVSVGIDQVELQSAELGTLASVSTPAETVFRGIASARIADTQRTMHESLDLNVGHSLMDVAYLLKREFAGEHYPAEPHVSQALHLFGCAVVGLRAGVYLKTKLTTHVEQCHVLYEHGIDARLLHLGEHVVNVV